MQEGLLLQERYYVHYLIGRGAQGECWLVQEEDQYWLAKIYRLTHEGWERYTLVEREANILRQLESSVIPKFRDMFVLPDESALCLIREWIPGLNLEQFVEQQRTSETEVRKLGRQLLEVLHYIHSLSPAVIHRDIKPTNVIIKPNNTATLIDFGSVRDVIYSEQGASVVGTYGYTPSEQFLGHPSPASDLYALGATLIFMLSRQHPSTLPITRNRLVFEPYINVSQRFLRILQRLLAPIVEERFQSAREVMEALDRCETTAHSAPATQHTIRTLPIPSEPEEGLSTTGRVERSRTAARKPHWQRNREGSKPWTWEHEQAYETNEPGHEWQPPHPNLNTIVEALQTRYQLKGLDTFSNPLELVDAIDQQFARGEEEGRQWLIRLLHPYDAADILFGYYDPTFLFKYYMKPLQERFALLLTQDPNNAIGQWVLLYFLYKYEWHDHQQRLLHSPLKTLKIEGQFPTRWGPLSSSKRFLEQFEKKPLAKQVKLYERLLQHQEQISRHYQICISLRPSHISVLIEQGPTHFEREYLPTYDATFQREWFEESWFRRMLQYLTFWPPRRLSNLVGRNVNKYQKLGNYAASLHILHALLEQNVLKLKDEYHWMLQEKNKSS